MHNLRLGADVIIIGAGPAGCAAAITSLQSGFRTCIIHKTIPPGEGDQASESVHPGIESILSTLHAEHCLKAAFRGVYEGIQTGDQFSSLGADNTGPWLGLHINRFLFDRELLRCAEMLGAEVVPDETVTGFSFGHGRVTGVQTASGKHFTGRYVIDASGHKQAGGRLSGFKEIFFTPPLITWTGITECTVHRNPLFVKQFTRFIPLSNGWTWLAPEPPSKCTWTRLSLKGKHPFLPPDELREYPLAGKIKVTNRRWRLFRPLCSEGVILCGDAAGLLDPAAGQGILLALMSGMMAVRTVVSVFRKPDLEGFYLAQYDEWFSRYFLDKAGKLKKYYTDLEINIFNV
jgi:flavin-dependent dehydrogenase